MLIILIGALLVIAGVLSLVATAIWKRPTNGPNRVRAGETGRTREPSARDITIFGLSGNWPGLALMVLGGILLLAGAMF